MGNKRAAKGWHFRLPGSCGHKNIRSVVKPYYAAAEADHLNVQRLVPTGIKRFKMGVVKNQFCHIIAGPGLSDTDIAKVAAQRQNIILVGDAGVFDFNILICQRIIFHCAVSMTELIAAIDRVSVVVCSHKRFHFNRLANSRAVVYIMPRQEARRHLLRLGFHYGAV